MTARTCIGVLRRNSGDFTAPGPVAAAAEAVGGPGDEAGMETKESAAAADVASEGLAGVAYAEIITVGKK